MIEDLIEQIEARFAELGEQMSDPEVIGDRERYAEVGRAYRQLEPAAELAAQWRRASDDAAGAEELIAEDGDDPELREMLNVSRERVLAIADLERLGLEPDAFGITGEHAVDVARPQPRLVATGAALDFYDHVLLVVWVALDHREADLLFELLDALARCAEHLAQLWIVAIFGNQLLRTGGIVACVPPLRGKLGGGLELAIGAPDLGVAFAVTDHLGVGHLLAELGKARFDLLDQVFDHEGQSMWRGATRPKPAAPRTQ